MTAQQQRLGMDIEAIDHCILLKANKYDNDLTA